MSPGLEEEVMNSSRPRETAPLWVWLAIALMLIIGIVYVTGYWMVEEVIAHKK
jgi:membrane protein YdbS with pleckstrin-like domain